MDSDNLLAVIRKLALAGQPRVSSGELAHLTGASLATVKRHLDKLVQARQLTRNGRARATRYAPAASSTRVEEPVGAYSASVASVSPPWSADGLALLSALNQPLGARPPVTYRRAFVDDYIPNQTFLLKADLAHALAEEGRMQGQQPAGTYARKVLEQLLIDLSWSSSRLEGNTYSLLATAELFKEGATAGDADAVMLLNHKRAIEFMVDAVPEYGLTAAIVRNLHAVLMQDLLDETDALGKVRSKVVNIHGTAYIPTQIPSLLEEMFALVIDKARQIKNPLEAAFFLWVNLAYLQCFEDGNKRTSRLAANIPLMLYNCAPLSFLDVDRDDYALAMMGVYELLDVALAQDLFVWTYRRSLAKYNVILASLGAPNPLRLRYRESLIEAMQSVVGEGKSVEGTLSTLALPEQDTPLVRAMLIDELKKLEVHNCARYRLSMRAVGRWITQGRPQ